MDDSIVIHKVPEVLLRKRKRTEVNQARSIANEIRSKSRKNSSMGTIRFKRAEKFVKEYLSKERFDKSIQRRAKRSRSTVYPVSETPGLIFAVRIETSLALHSKASKVLNLLKLRIANRGVFLKLNQTTLQLLKMVEPYITWGTPNLKIIRELLFKRGNMRTSSGGFKALNDNALIEKKLGKFGIICIEDIVHEIATLGENFQHVNLFVCQFKLNMPSIGWKKVSLPYGKGGDYGDRSSKINLLLEKMI